MRNAILKFGAVAGVAGTLSLAAFTPSFAAPVSTGAITLKSAVTSDVVEVRGRGRWGYYGGAFAGGLALGALAARPYYYGYGPYYDPYYYGPPPAAVYGPPPGPAYMQPYPDPNGPVRQCWVATDKDRGFGYYRPC